jgi:peptidoglycan/LPS O-acetylase OafA/YrhL
MVLLAHLAGTRGFPLSSQAGNALGLGELGVRIFFVISGFLITGLLFDELSKTGGVSLRHFYLRRTLRIFPPYYVFLTVVGVAALASRIQLADNDLVHAFTYTSNYDAGRSWFIGHTWSLSVEEQFYLLWPALLVFAGMRRALLVAALVVVAVPLVRVASWELMRASGDGIGHRFETVADAIAIGCVLAGARARLHRTPWYVRGLDSRWFLLVPVAGFAANMLHDHPVAHFLFGISITSVSAALCLDWCVTHADGRVGRFLNAAPIAFVGTLSYSLYLWQQLFLNRSSINAASSFPLNLVLACLATLCSFYLVERPSLRLRRAIEASWRRRAQPAQLAQWTADVGSLTPVASADR